MATYGQKPIGGFQLPTDPSKNLGRETVGFVTPSQDLMPQKFSVPPRRVIPIVFIPGIMGSNLRLKPERQKALDRKDNVAWRPDFMTFCVEMMNTDATERQQLLDSEATEVDTYDPVSHSTGNSNETADQRNSKVAVSVVYPGNVGPNSPMLLLDPPSHPNQRTRDQKARERGWGEVFFSSYSTLLELCEEKLNGAFNSGILNGWWREIIDTNPEKWQASKNTPLTPLTEETLRSVVTGCWFPVHAMGYNWLQSNEKSGIKLAKRIEQLIQRYQRQGYQCEKVMLVTHSMGGLAARAVIHPAMGNIHDKVLGVVHGVMPAIGAAATYKRMRCGFEGAAANVLGKDGKCVTAVLANAEGGLELLPSKAYGKGWLKVRHNGKIVLNLPESGDPYEEIYKVQDRWYALFNVNWVNPVGRKDRGIQHSTKLVERAKNFHENLADHYHAVSYAHYGADAKRLAWQAVTWVVQSPEFTDVHKAEVIFDTANGTIRLKDVNAKIVGGMGVAHSIARMQPPTDAGDETVPVFSADAQLRSGKFRGIFRQTGYEHQGSYKNDAALHSTLYSLVRIASEMKWSKK